MAKKDETAKPAKLDLTPAQKKRAKEMQEELADMGLAIVNPEAIKKMQDDMATMMQNQKQQDTLIRSVADKGRLAKEDSKGAAPLQRTVRIQVYNDDGEERRVLGWSNLVNDQVYKNSSGVYVEKQIMRLVLERLHEETDDKRMDVPYLDFVKKTRSINATIQKRLEDEETGNLILNVVDDEGKEFDISATFVN